MQAAPVLDAARVEQLIRDGLPMSAFGGFTVESITPGTAQVRLRFRDWMIRPGGTVAGPVLMMAADAAMYAVILAHIGEQLLAVTSNLNIHFLAKPKPVDVLAEARLLRLGRRQAVCEVLLHSEGEDELIAHVTGSYALPSAKPV
jgi:uncharacterized protein (TIGR00369 family)